MFSLKRVVSCGGIIVHQCTSLSANFSAYQCLASPKRKSPYSTADSERYSSLVKSVMSSRVSAQTPETLNAEDEHIYGPVIKTQMPSSGPKVRVPQTLHPFLHSKETLDTEEPEAGPPTRIALNRGRGRSSVPSVTRILQHTLSPEQVFYLDRWKRKMIAELGEEGFKEYSQSKFRFSCIESCANWIVVYGRQGPLKKVTKDCCVHLDIFRQGKLFHSAVEDILMSGGTWENKDPSEKAELPPEVQGYMESISHILEDVRAVRAIESTVQHDTLNYVGIADCVARYR